MAIINQGELVLHGDPTAVLDEAQGRVWRKRVARDSLAKYEREYAVLSVRLAAGEPIIHVWGESSPGSGFEQVQPVLEDVYFHRVGPATALEA